MLTPSSAPESCSRPIISLPDNDLAHPDHVAPPVAPQAKTPAHQPHAKPADFNWPVETREGADILLALARAYERAIGERHAFVTMDHFLFGIAEEEVSAKALVACGVNDVSEFELELLNIVHKMPMSALAQGEQPTIDNAVLSAMAHAQGYARQNGRDVSNMSDMLQALLEALKRNDPDTPGMKALRGRWPQATEVNEIYQILLQMRELQANQPAMIARTLAEELATLRNRVSALEQSPPKEPAARMVPWYQRLNILVFALAVVSIGASLSIIGG